MNVSDELLIIFAKTFKYIDTPIQGDTALYDLFQSKEPVGELYEQKASKFLIRLSQIKLESELTSLPLYSHVKDVIYLIGELLTKYIHDLNVASSLIERYMHSLKGVIHRMQWNTTYPSSFDYLFDMHDLLDCVVTNNRITTGTDNTVVIEVKHHSVPLPIRVRPSGTFKQGDLISLYECSFYLSESGKFPVFFVTGHRL